MSTSDLGNICGHAVSGPEGGCGQAVTTAEGGPDEGHEGSFAAALTEADAPEGEPEGSFAAAERLGAGGERLIGEKVSTSALRS